jgi:hypothetical protein
VLFVPLAISTRDLYEADYAIGAALATGLALVIGGFRGGFAAGLLIPDWRPSWSAVVLVCAGYVVIAYVLAGESGAGGALLFSLAPGLCGAALGTALRVAGVSLFHLVRGR